MSFEDESDVVIHYSFDVWLSRIIDNVILPTKLSVKAEIVVDDDAENDTLEAALTKIKYWIENCVTNSIACAANNAEAMSIILTPDGTPRTGNVIMLTPEEPSDDFLAIIFQAKLTALSAGALIVCDVDIKSETAPGLSFTYVGTGEGVLPPMTDWVGERNWFSEPWWHRDDASMIDTQPSEDADLTVPPKWAVKLDFLAERQAIPDGIVVKGSFSPTVIDGEKD